jgi:flagellar motor switch protein FliN
MAELTPEIAAVVRAACETNADEAAGAFTRTFDAEISVSVGSEGVCDLEQLPEGCDGPGLLVLFTFGSIGAIGVLPQATGLLPVWYAEPDPTGQSKLTTLAQELSMLLVPEEFQAEDFKAARVDHLGSALAAAGISSGAGLVPLRLAAGETSGTFHLFWPCSKPDQAFQATEVRKAQEALAAAVATDANGTATEPVSMPEASSRTTVESLDGLPPYTRSLLRIKVPVMVTLACKKQSIHQIVELGAGSIIKFEKSCEEMLDLEVGGLPIAQGEAVKVGDKFGLRISAMILPGERFNKLGATRRGA